MQDHHPFSSFLKAHLSSVVSCFLSLWTIYKMYLYLLPRQQPSSPLEQDFTGSLNHESLPRQSAQMYSIHSCGLPWSFVSNNHGTLWPSAVGTLWPSAVRTMTCWTWPFFWGSSSEDNCGSLFFFFCDGPNLEPVDIQHQFYRSALVRHTLSSATENLFTRFTLATDSVPLPLETLKFCNWSKTPARLVPSRV